MTAPRIPMDGEEQNPLAPMPVTPMNPNPARHAAPRRVERVTGPAITPAQPAPKPIQPANNPNTPLPTPTAPVSGSQGGVGLAPTNPNNALTTQTIQPGQMADRVQLAQQRFDQFVQNTSPAYQAALRNANRLGAAQGRLGSGSLRTDFGNLANLRNQQMDTARNEFLTAAQEGSIEDAWRAIGLAERQQAFQNQQQMEAWRRAMDQFQAGQASNPYGAQQDRAAMYGQAGADASRALADYWRSMGQRGPTRGAMSPTPPFNPSAPMTGY